MGVLEGIGVIALIIIIIILFACLSLIFKACDFVFDIASDGCSEGCGCIIFVLLILAALTCI